MVLYGANSSNSSIDATDVYDATFDAVPVVENITNTTFDPLDGLPTASAWTRELAGPTDPSRPCTAVFDIGKTDAGPVGNLSRKHRGA